MTYQQTIDYLFTRLPMYSRIGFAAFKKDLTNTIKLCNYLGNPQQKFKNIHIAGTNGKGSVSHMLAAILQKAGYKTGLYTSPHLNDFRERIRINGQMVSREFVTGFTEKIKPLIEETEPSFFEITVAMAFDYFREQEVDVAVIEVGLGGRLDSTNIILPELSIITQIGYDHMNILGDTLEKIAIEKAGIIKPGVPVVIGEYLPETKTVFEKTAQEKKAPLSLATEKRTVTGWKWEKQELVVEVEEFHNPDHRHYHLDLPGIYQVQNLLTVLEACSVLHRLGWKTTEESIRPALRQVKKMTGFHGRWETVHHHPLVILDVAHNEDGIKKVVQQLELTDHKELHIILGLVRDKEIEKVLNLLPRSASYYFTQATIPRAFPSDMLQQKAGQFGLSGHNHPDVNAAMREALFKAGPDDLVLVCGSIFLVGEVVLPIK